MNQKNSEGRRSDRPERRILLGVGLVFALLLLGYLVYKISAVGLVLLVTMLFTIIVSWPVDYLERRGWSRGAGTAAVFAGLIVFFGGIGSVLVPTMENQARQLIETFPELLSNAQNFVRGLQSSLGLDLAIPLDSQSMLDSARNFLSGGALSAVAGLGASVASGVSYGVVVLIATIYTVLNPRPIVNGFVALFPAARREPIREVLGAMYGTVQRWFIGQLTSMLIIGTLWTISLFIIGIPFALLLGIFSGVVSFVPFVGPAISLIPPVLLALVNAPLLAVWVVIVYLAIQTIESYFIQPIVMSRAVHLHPAVVIFAILAMGTLFGLIGVLLAVPLTAAIQSFVQIVWVPRMDSLGSDPNPPSNGAHTHRHRARRLLNRLSKAAGFLRRS